MSGGIIFDAYTIAFGLTLGAIAALVYALRAKHHRPRPFDWEKDGECDNRSHVRVVD